MSEYRSVYGGVDWGNGKVEIVTYRVPRPRFKSCGGLDETSASSKNRVKIYECCANVVFARRSWKANSSVNSDSLV